MNAVTALKKLHEARQQRQALEQQLATANELVALSPAYRHVQELKEQVAAAKLTESELRYAVEADALLAYRSRDTKQPFPGVSIRANRIVKYDVKVATAWCLTHLTLALKLDEATFDNQMKLIAKSKTDASPLPDFVKVEEDPSVVIVGDISKVMSELNDYDGIKEFPAGEFAPEAREG